MKYDNKKFIWLAAYAAEIGARLSLDGQCGIGRDCVGIMSQHSYLELPEDTPGKPTKAYHKHSCLAVLGHDEDAFNQLYDWCVALKNDGYNKANVRPNPDYDKNSCLLGILMGSHQIEELIKVG